MDNNLIFGIRPVAEAVEAGRQIEKLYIRKGAEGPLMQELKDLCMRHRLRWQEVPVEKLNRLTRGNHQGVVAQTAAIAYVELADILERVPEDETPLVVVFDGVTDVRNFGAIARSAECAGAHGLIVPAQELRPGECRGDPFVGRALTTIPVCRVGSVRNTLRQLQTEGFPGRSGHGEEPQAAIRRRFPPPDGDRHGGRGHGRIARGAQALRRAAGHSYDRANRVAERLGRRRGDALRGGAPADRGVTPGPRSRAVRESGDDR